MKSARVTAPLMQISQVLNTDNLRWGAITPCLGAHN